MSDLPRYSGPMSICVKCGCADAGTVYYDDDVVTLTTARSLTTMGGEYHERTCRRCGYIWCEGVLA